MIAINFSRQATIVLIAGYSVFGIATNASPVEPSPVDLAANIASKSVSLRWDFEDLPTSGQLSERASIDAVGPTGLWFVNLPEVNRALVLKKECGWLRVPDSLDAGPLDFTAGDAITLEAWVKIDSIGKNANVYIVGKGRTYESSRIENQNYALRLRESSGTARVSFLFATADSATAVPTYHRWTSDKGFAPDDAWHHVAVSYQFGTPGSVKGFIDGESTKGKWDMGGETKLPPITDNDSLWIGSSRGGDPSNSLIGAIDDVRIHRTIVSAAEIARRRVIVPRPPQWIEGLEPSRVTMTLHPGVKGHTAWPLSWPSEAFRFSTPALAIPRLPMRYDSGGVRNPWQSPLLLRAYCKTPLPVGDAELLLRSPGLARLWVDGQTVLTTPAHRTSPSAHQPFEVYKSDLPWLRVPRVGDVEQRAKVTLDNRPHEVVLEQIVGADGLRSETGDTTVAVRSEDGMFYLVGPNSFDSRPLTDEGWHRYRSEFDREISKLENELRRTANDRERDFWDQRHNVAREYLAKLEPLNIPLPTTGLQNETIVDRYIHSKLLPQLADKSVPRTDESVPRAERDSGQRKTSPTPTTTSIQANPQPDALLSILENHGPVDDRTFLRRIYLDCIGIPPTADQVAAFLKDPSPNKRQRRIDELLADPRWADHWTSYWQDVLAENPSILKPSLNNSGPFRFWIHDALLDDKPMDRFVTELVRMEGDKYGGGPAGFGIAAENDVPMAAKAHVLANAFLAVEMKCARCHDAPNHPWTQGELFGLAAMLERKSIKVPASSSVPKAFFDRKGNSSSISVSLTPGDEIAPKWPFNDFGPQEVDPKLLGRGDSPRERLAAYLTRAENTRFPQVIVNRVWQRFMGWGLVDSQIDWLGSNPRNLELLEYLGRELVTSGYSLKHLAALIMNSQAYQRSAMDSSSMDQTFAFAAPWIRRMTAEQIVDSIHYVSGIELETEEITFDREAQQKVGSFSNLGVARRAWELTSLSNERDRPSLALPQAAAVVDCLEAFGWRGARQEPISHRDVEPNMVQPGVIANGAMTTRATRLTDESWFTREAIDAKSPEQLTQRLFEQILSRLPSPEEQATFAEQLRPGFDDRIASLAPELGKPPVHRGFATWANHFSPESSALMLAVQREVVAGPEPTKKLKDSWRQRAEDAVWSLLNAPEMQFIQ